MSVGNGSGEKRQRGEGAYRDQAFLELNEFLLGFRVVFVVVAQLVHEQHMDQGRVLSHTHRERNVIKDHPNSCRNRHDSHNT